MIIKNLALRLMSIVLAVTWPTAVLAQRSKPEVIELAATDGGSKIASIHLNDQNLLFESDGGSESFLFTGEALFAINHKDKTYRVQSYDDLRAMAKHKADEIAKSQESAGNGTGVELRLTRETGTIAGSRVRKLIELSRGKTEAEIWVSRDLTPMKLRAFGEKMRAILTGDYYKKAHGAPGLVEIIMTYGVPLKIVSEGQNTYQARVLEDSGSSASFQVPSGYRKVDN